MARIAYVNGRYLPIDRASVPIEDRGFQFADSIYDVLKQIRGRLIDADRHLARLRRSLSALQIVAPCSDAALRQIVAQTLRRNRLNDALVYIQVSRGTAPRNHPFPASTRPTLVVSARRLKLPTLAEQTLGVGVVTTPDLRWKRCDIKSTGLLANVLAKQRAQEAGCREAWLVARDLKGEPIVTEGGSTNAWIVDEHGVLRTHPVGNEILGGVTRSVVLELAQSAGVELAERAFTLNEVSRAREAFLTSATSLVLPVTTIDGQSVADEKPGGTTRRLMESYARHCGLMI